MYTERKLNTGLIALILFIAALIVFFFHTRGAQKTLTATRAQADALAQEVAAIESKQSGSESGVLTEVEERELTALVPSQLDQDRLVADISRMSEESDVTFTSLTFSLQKNASVPAIGIAGGFQGSYQSIARFLKAIEINPRKLVVKDASIARSKTEGGAELVNLNLNMESYYQGLQAE